MWRPSYAAPLGKSTRAGRPGGAFALHVADEALTDFLGVYNPTVLAIRERYPWVRLPTYTFDVWLTLLILAVSALKALSPLALRGASGLVPVAYIFATIMLLNGLLHLAASIYLGRVMPGAYSSPFLLVAAMYLLTSLRRREGR